MQYKVRREMYTKIEDAIRGNAHLENCEREAFFSSLDNCFLFPGFVDVHVHLREPGFFYKETIESGTRAAARGGYTAVCSMPNVKPVPDDAASLLVQTKKIAETAQVAVYPYGAITRGQMGEVLSDMEAMAPNVIAFSDDGRGVQSDAVMENAMQKAKRLGKMIVAHCEDNRFLNGGYIHDGAYAAAHGHRGIPSESEWRQLARDIELVRKTGCSYHACHISTKESVELIRKAKREGLDVSCETAPHYLVLTDSMLEEDGRFKMNPPIREEADRLALLEGIQDGTVDMIATDHAPHSEEEKSRGLAGSVMGVVGLETAFSVLYTKLVKTNKLSLDTLINCMSKKPSERFGIPLGDDYSLWDMEKEYKICPADFASMGKSTPFSGWNVFAKCILTVKDGKAVYIGLHR